MDRRQSIALLTLGIVGAGVGGLILTADDDATAPADETATSGSPSSSPTTVAPNVPDLPDRGLHPPLLANDGWLQSGITSLEELKGKVVAVQFWTFGCHNCTATIPHMRALYDKYDREDFEIVGIHAAEFEFEKDPEAISEAAADQGVTWPILLDTDKKSFRSWQDRRFWPRLYLLDRDGHIRYDKIGEGRYDEIDAAVGALISETSA